MPERLPAPGGAGMTQENNLQIVGNILQTGEPAPIFQIKLNKYKHLRMIYFGTPPAL